MVEKTGNLILELVPAAGTGSFTLGTPAPRRLPWSYGVASGLWVAPAQVYYFADDTEQQEWGYGTYTTGRLTRDQVIWTSNNSNAKINFQTLPVYLYPEIPAERMVYRDPATGDLIVLYKIQSPHLIGSTDVTAPHLIGSTDVTAPHLIGTTDVTGPAITATGAGGTVSGPHLVATADITTPKLIVSGGTIEADHIVGDTDVTGTRVIAKYQYPGYGDLQAYTQNGGPLGGLRNKLINPQFSINNRGYAQAYAPAGAYMHDRWRSGSGGSTGQGGRYTFTAGNPNAGINILDGSVFQWVEASLFDNSNLPLVLSWAGSAVGRAANNGTFTYSPIAVPNPENGAMWIEFTNGTLGNPQLETGTFPTMFQVRSTAMEQFLCSYYFQTGAFNFSLPQAATVTISLALAMRVQPTIIVAAPGYSPNLAALNKRDLLLQMAAGGAQGTYTADADL